jgi:Trypsin-co-occurring domain 1
MVRSGGDKDNPPVDILVEVRPSATSGDLAPRVSIPEDFRRRAGEIADSVAEIAEQFRTRLRTVLASGDDGWGVESIEIGFDIAVQAEAGVVIAKASTGATLSAKLTLKARQELQ